MTPELSLVPEAVLSEQLQFKIELSLVPRIPGGRILAPLSFRITHYSLHSPVGFFTSKAFLTPTERPVRPLVLVLCPLTLRPRLCLMPFQERMFSMKDMSA